MGELSICGRYPIGGPLLEGIAVGGPLIGEIPGGGPPIDGGGPKDDLLGIDVPG